MPDVFGPFDGVPWAQAQWYRDAPLWAPSGVAGSPAQSTTTGDLPLTISGLTASIGLGRAHVRGAGYERTGTPSAFTVNANTNATLSRLDRIVLRRDLTAKTVQPFRLQGTAASTPVAPTLTQSENGIWDIPLFRFRVQPASSTVLADVTDERQFVGPDFARAALTINGGWGSVAGFAAQCFMTSPGRVALAGRFTNGGSFTPDFTQFPLTLPVGYRPIVPQVFVIPMSAGRKMNCTIFTDGQVRLDGEGTGASVPAGTTFFMDPVVFDVFYTGA